MKRIIIICEGPDRKRISAGKYFMLLFLTKTIALETPIIKKSSGGIVSWVELKKQIESHLIVDPAAIVTTFYRLLWNKRENTVFQNGLKA